jgi:tRNA (guanine37-N1)-methyltransferase
MRIDVLTLFPELISQYCKTSILGIALQKQLYELMVWNPREYSSSKHKSVDDSPYGGGAGMLLSPQPYCDCLNEVLEQASDLQYEIIITSPSGQTFNQDLALDLSQKQRLILLCGRYEGFDQRIKERATMEISIGDYVLTGGELAALTIVDAVLRHCPGVLGDESSTEFESFSRLNYYEQCNRLQVSKKELQALLDHTGINLDQLRNLQILEFPQYTRPFDYQGQSVPAVLESGDHKKIFLWRLEQAIILTKQRRPDLIK